MGCDIHTLAQIKVGDTWRIVPDWEDDFGRHYDTFAVMAGVRNGNALEVLYRERGLPKDVKEFLEAQEGDLNDDGYIWLGEHTFSWLTLTELKRISMRFMSDIYSVQGKVDSAGFKRIRVGLMPESWVVFPHISHWIGQDSEDSIDGSLLHEIIDQLEELKTSFELSDDDIRLVFGFDS